jgi:SAM-dependent methyltransferase
VNGDVPSAWVARWTAHLAIGDSALDLASGSGRHTRLLAARGCKITAVDSDSSIANALAAVPNVEFIRSDLEAAPWPLPGRQFDAVIVTNYLHRPLFAAIKSSLAPGGLLIYETFAAGNASFGRPSNPAYLLRPRELLEVFGSDMRVLAFEDGFIEQPKPAMVQRIAARNARPDAALAAERCHL